MDKEAQSVAGHLFALQVVVSALLRSHPNPESVFSEISPLADAARDSMLPTMLPDGVLASFESELKLLLLGLER